MASYDIIEGNRKDSIVYRHGAYTFRKDKDPHGVRYLRCVRYRNGCSARARIDLDSDTFSVIGEHEGHESTENQIEISKVISKLKRRAEFRKERFVKYLTKKPINQKLEDILAFLG